MSVAAAGAVGGGAAGGLKVAFWVFGCRLNQAEAAGWQAALVERGYAVVERAAADVLCVHSCAVTEPAVHEVLKGVRAYRRQHPGVGVVLSGCAAELLPAGLAEVVLPHARKAEWVAQVVAYLEARAAAGGGARTAAGVAAPVAGRTRASLIVQDGCDRFCAYCIVPYMRGGPVSRPMAACVAQAAALLEKGYREIVLTGCHLALYRDPDGGGGLLALLERLCELPGGGRFRLGSLEPCVVDDRALARMIARSGGRLCAFLHLPIQCAADRVLAAMGRTYTQAQLRGVLDAVCSELPYCGLGADWIVGLPGEGEREAAETRALLADYPFTGAHIFPYSRRPGTRAAAFPGQVAPAQMKARVQAFRQVAAEVRERACRRFVGRELEVIPERHRGVVREGWSAEYLRCRLPGEVPRGEPVRFRPGRFAGGIFLP